MPSKYEDGYRKALSQASSIIEAWRQDEMNKGLDIDDSKFVNAIVNGILVGINRLKVTDVVQRNDSHTG